MKVETLRPPEMAIVQQLMASWSIDQISKHVDGGIIALETYDCHGHWCSSNSNGDWGWAFCPFLNNVFLTNTWTFARSLA